MKLFISPPFGNYFNLYNSTSVKGTFTLNPRNGLLKQIFKTLRYSFKNDGWINKIGLRNKGIKWAIKKYKNTNNIISIAILNEADINAFNEIIPKNMNLEINISCPNIEKKLDLFNIKELLNKNRQFCSIKL